MMHPGLEFKDALARGTLFLQVRNNLTHVAPRMLKRVFDIVAASLILLLVMPLMAYVAWRLWREEGGAVLFAQWRIGLGGKKFRFLKFRSMVRDADAVLAGWKHGDPQLYARYVNSNFKLSDDPRVTPVGAWIRRTSIDELPQLINVIRGDMSLVGPRPLLARELPDYDAEAFALYTAVRPGITGLWQISGRSRTSFHIRAALDMAYVRHWSVWQDVVILLKTVRVVLARDGAY